jgi:hypothetical protein
MSDILTPSGAVPVEEREEYRLIRDAVLHFNLKPEQVLDFMAKAYSDEADRLDKTFFSEEMTPELTFQYQKRIRELKGLAKGVRNAKELCFATLPHEAGWMKPAYQHIA